ncbi:hypothetical protein DSCA_54430 [Desulfosarcina alkanivorans]|uniref:DUF2914 domain-containing protein n=1 Tax=Desulfosarcina alkanivorans TaxID=571177 RepID=A0A5K7YTY0_9BACT|nr:DUF2914 domain-containing protein [Desulfosarcina alkanivorans]BBO71513.1 hypothetical protein DSCA_54430 [Desulfosarcina alkanivorans]
MNNRCLVSVIVGLVVWGGLSLATVMAREITVAQAVVCQEVVDRVPVGAGDVIPAGTERVFCFTRIEGAGGDAEITHNWYYQGSLKASVVLPVRAGSWRTWSSKKMLPEWTGEWMIEVLSKDGTPLESVIFFVQ